jgi:chromosome segregation ATPase
MSKVKTRNEIKQEMDDLSTQIEQMKTDHAGQIADLEAKVTELTESNESATATIESLKTELAEAQEAGIEATDKLTEAENRIEAITAEKVEAEIQLKKAKNALANPAHMDAAITPTEIDQSVEDAAADAQEKNANQDEPKEPENVLEEYEAMERSPERAAFFQKHERQILQLISDRENA